MMRVSNFNPLTGNPLSGDKRPRLEPTIFFYEVGYDDNSDNGYDSLIHVKIDKASMDTNKKLRSWNSR